MTKLASSIFGRLALKAAVTTLRPFRFRLGIVRRAERPLSELVTL